MRVFTSEDSKHTEHIVKVEQGEVGHRHRLHGSRWERRNAGLSWKASVMLTLFKNRCPSVKCHQRRYYAKPCLATHSLCKHQDLVIILKVE